jgi:hypothetical protein
VAAASIDPAADLAPEFDGRIYHLVVINKQFANYAPGGLIIFTRVEVICVCSSF